MSLCSQVVRDVGLFSSHRNVALFSRVLAVGVITVCSQSTASHPGFSLPSSNQQVSAEFPALRSQKSSNKSKQPAAKTTTTVKPKKEEVSATQSTFGQVGMAWCLDDDLMCEIGHRGWGGRGVNRAWITLGRNQDRDGTWDAVLCDDRFTCLFDVTEGFLCWIQGNWLMNSARPNFVLVCMDAALLDAWLVVVVVLGWGVESVWAVDWMGCGACMRMLCEELPLAVV